MELIRGSGTAPIEGVSDRSCTLAFLFSKTALEDPFTAAEGFYMGLDPEVREGPR
jgi:hypothetical protein